MSVEKVRKYTPEDSVDNLVSSLVTEQMEAILNKMISNLKKDLKNIAKDSTKAVTEVYDTLDDLETQYNSKKIDMFAKTSETQKKIIQVQAKFEESLMQKSNANERIALLDTQAARIKEFQKTYEKQKKLQEELAKDKEIWDLQESDRQQKLSAIRDETERNRLQKQYDAEKAALDKRIAANQKYLDTHSESDYGNSGAQLRDIELDKANIAAKSGSEESRKESEDAMKELLKQDKNDAQAKKALSDLTQKDLQEAAEHRREEKNEEARKRREEAKFRKEQLKTLLGFNGIKEALEEWKNTINDGFDAMMEAIEEPISTFFEYQAKYEARLQGSQNQYDKMMTNINRQIGLSPFIKQQAMVKNLQEMIDKGINYNVELRAYLATVSEGIASTFDAFDSNLLRLIRIQQNDSTAARLGIEAALTKFFNNMYSDTSYLSQGGPSDQVTAALLEASAQLTHQGAAEMEFVAQKWLGSLYSLGVSGEAVQSIAQGLGYLGSGNIEALSGNETLMSLLSMSASRGGTSISDILTGGLTASRTDMLLQGMVEYLAEIANNTDSNNVTRSSIAQVFGLTNTDLRSIMNLSQNDIDKISKTDINYGGALAETSYQLTQIAGRTHLSQMISNVIENAKNGAALTIGGNPAMYGLAKALGVVSSLVGDRGLEIPGIQVLGTGTASGIDILSIAKAGILGTTLLSTLIGSLSSLAGGGLPSLSSWKGYEKALERGKGLELQPKGVQSGFSESAQYNYRGSGSTSDLGAASMQSANESARENQSEEDRQTADLAEKFYEEGLDHLAKMREIIEDLATSNNSYKLNVSLDNSYDKPLPVTIAPLSDDSSTSMSMKITDITDNASNKLNAAFKAIILSAFADETINAQGESVLPLATQIANALSGLNVNIVNDWFDEAIQNSALGGSRG